MSGVFGKTVIKEGEMLQEEFNEGTAFLDLPLSETGIWVYFKTYFWITLQAIMIGGFYVLHSTTISAGVYFSGQTGNAKVEAAFGTAQFINGFFTEYLSLAIVESSTVLAAEYFGSNEFAKAKRTFFQGLLLNAAFYLVIFVPFYFFAERIFLATGFGSTDALLSAIYYKRLFWIYLISNSTAHLFGLGVSQGHLKELIAATVGHWLIAYGLIYYFGVYRGMGLEGWFLAKLIQQSLEFVTFAIICIFRVKAWLGVKVYISGIFKDYSQFVTVTLLVLVCWYSGQLSSAIATFFVQLARSDEEIAANNSFNSINDYVFQYGTGFAIVGWTFFARLFGQRRVLAARRFSMMFLGGQLFLSILISVTLWYASPFLADLFESENRVIRDYLLQLLRSYCYVLFADFSMNFLFRVSQGIGWTWVTAILNVAFLLVAQTITAYLITFKMHGGAVAINLNLYILQAVAFVAMLIVIAASDWQALAEEQGALLSVEKDSTVQDIPAAITTDVFTDYSPILSRSLIRGDLTPRLFSPMHRKAVAFVKI